MNQDKHGPHIPLDAHLCFSLYACSRAIFRMYRPLLDDLDLTYPQYLVLLALWEHETMSVKDISEQLVLDSGTLTPMLKRMEAAGLVRRERSKEDERVLHIRITDKGIALKDQSMCVPKSLLEASGMSEAEIGVLNGTIQKLLNQINENSSAK
ncbi:organic hydroperoxide resistance transcriptional regulator [Paenibacillus glycanilyticus]|uniref:Organic hydroperoxide resistance transcriptional regulator n=1 Tax=Paenibacillus glycanilyticus TaxID=126569 RepID=A0ABQ6NRW7_9BACL|nr:MarR family transcriptional regulator [Paenibacillus glycanilyticus]GMK47856.1 organic hydroperoxide resistance transcriptional regulator [Paenibacillus glycanilyticus]